MPLVTQHDGQAGVEEGQLAQPAFQHGIVELHLGEGAGGRLERHLGPARRIRRPDDRKRRLGIAMAEADEMLLAQPPDAHLHPFRQRVHHRGAHAMQAAGNLVGILVELAAGMQLGQHHLGGGDAFLVVDVGRNAAPVVAHRHAAIAVQRQRHPVGMAGLGLVHRVVDDLESHMMQAGAVIGVADIHARPLAHGIQATQHGDRGGVVGVVIGGGGGGFRLGLRRGVLGHAEWVLRGILGKLST